VDLLIVDDKQLVKRLEQEIEERRKSLPAHSVPAAMIIELEDLEEQLRILQVELDKNTDAPA